MPEWRTKIKGAVAAEKEHGCGVLSSHRSQHFTDRQTNIGHANSEITIPNSGTYYLGGNYASLRKNILIKNREKQ